MIDEYKSLKLVLLGDSSVGKSSILSYFINGNSDGISQTIGGAFLTKYMEVNEKKYELLIWDTSGQESYRGLAPMYYRSAVIAIVVYDITKKNTLESVDYWITELKNHLNREIVIVIVGNKVDLEDRQVEYNEAELMAQKCGSLYIETSAKTGFNIERLFQTVVQKYVETSVPITPDPTIDVTQTNNASNCC